MKNDIGLKHIAMNLGVSLTTVSRALRDCSDISEEMKEKVREEALKLKYTPNAIARALATGKSSFIAIIVDSLVSPYFSYVVDLLTKEFKEKGYNVCLLPTANIYCEKENIKEAIGIGAAAIITFLIPRRSSIELAALSNKPILLFGRSVDADPINLVYTDDKLGGELAAKYLVETKGAKKLCYVGNSLHEIDEYRKSGFILEASRLGINDVVCVDTIEKMDLGAIESNDCDGIFCFDDQLAYKVYEGINHSNLSIVGFNGLSQFVERYFDAPFASLTPDYEAMICDAIKTIISQITSSDDSKNIKHKYEVKIIN